MRKSFGKVMLIGALAAVIACVVAQGIRRESKTAPTVAQLRRAATTAIEAAGGKWATLRPGRENGTWVAIVIRADLSRAVVFLNEHFEVIRVASVGPAHKARPLQRSLAAAPPEPESQG